METRLGALGAPSPRERCARAGVAIVGRAAERDAIREAFEAGRRLVTLLGPPGVGKTTLARALLDATCADRRGVFVDLSEATDRSAIKAAIATPLDVSLGALGRGDDVAAIAGAIGRAGPMLLVLDNAENVAAELAELVTELLEAPDAR